MNMTTSNSSNALLTVPYQLNIWFGSFLWITCNLGSIGNLIVFCSRSLRHRAYSVYLLFQAIMDIFYYNSVLLTRILERGFQIPISNRYDIMCKLRQFFSVWGNQVSFSLFLLATVDRLLSAQRSNRYRQWSNRVSLAYKLSITVLFIWLLFFGHRLILYRIQNGKCVALIGFYADCDNYLEVIFTGVCPPIVMSVLAYLLIRSVRNLVQRQIVPTTHTPSIKFPNRTVLQQMDSQLTLMLILQSIISTLAYIPYAIQLIYTHITQYWPKSSLKVAQEVVFVEVIHLFSYAFFASSFYILLVSSSGFRRHLKYLFHPCNNNNPINMAQAKF